MACASVNGTQLWYSDAGAGPPLLVIHGAGSDGRLWADDLTPLQDARRVITFTRRGYVGSGPAVPDWTLHADDAAALAASLEAVPTAVLAHSGGSIGALEVAIRHPELVTSLVLLEPAYGTRRNATPGLAVTFAKVRILHGLGQERRALETWLRYVWSYRTGGSAFDRLSAERRERLYGNAPGVFADLAAGDGSHIDQKAISLITAPVTIITAELSPSFLHKASDSLARMLPNVAVRSLQGAGHAMARDRADELIRELRVVLDAAP